MPTALDLVTGALQELQAIGADETPEASDAVLGLRLLNRRLDLWNAQRAAVYTDVFTSLTLTPALSPHTIGPTGTITIPQRPESIEGAVLLRGGIRTPITIRQSGWWGALVQPTFGGMPTDLYYRPSWPNGELNFWPVPTGGDSVILQARIVLTAFALTDTVSLPPGYQAALELTLAEDLAAPMGLPVSPETRERARSARATVFSAHTVIPALDLRDAGVPGGGGWFDYRTGEVR